MTDSLAANYTIEIPKVEPRFVPTPYSWTINRPFLDDITFAIAISSSNNFHHLPYSAAMAREERNVPSNFQSPDDTSISYTYVKSSRALLLFLKILGIQDHENPPGCHCTSTPFLAGSHRCHACRRYEIFSDNYETTVVNRNDSESQCTTSLRTVPSRVLNS